MSTTVPNSSEIFQLNPHSSQEDMRRCLSWIEETFIDQQFISVSIIVKRTAAQAAKIEQQLKEDSQLGDKQRASKLSLKFITMSDQEKQHELKQDDNLIQMKQQTDDNGNGNNINNTKSSLDPSPIVISKKRGQETNNSNLQQTTTELQEEIVPEAISKDNEHDEVNNTQEEDKQNRIHSSSQVAAVGDISRMSLEGSHQQQQQQQSMHSMSDQIVASQVSEEQDEWSKESLQVVELLNHGLQQYNARAYDSAYQSYESGLKLISELLSNDESKNRPESVRSLHINKVIALLKISMCQLYITKKSDQVLSLLDTALNAFKNRNEHDTSKEDQNIDLKSITNPSKNTYTVSDLEPLSDHLDTQQEQELALELFSALGDAHQNAKNYQNSISFFQLALKVLETHPELPESLKLKGNLNNFLGLAYYCLGNISNAIAAFDCSLQICMQLNGANDIQVANRMNNLAEAYRNDKQYSKALELFNSSLSIKQKGEKNSKNIQGIGKTCQNIGITYQDMQNPTKAIEYYITAVSQFKMFYSDHYKDEGGVILSTLYTSLAECYKENQQLQEAAQYYEKVYEINKSMYGLKNKLTINCANSLATLLFKLELFEKSVELFEQILSFQKQYHGEDSLQVVQTLINMGTVFCKMKKYELGIEKIDLALSILEANPNSDPATIEKTRQAKAHFQKKIPQPSISMRTSKRELPAKVEDL